MATKHTAKKAAQTKLNNLNDQDFKDFILKIFSGNLTQNQKIFTTISLAWIIFIGYLTWWNGLKSFAVDKSFRWDEWFWFGIVPAISPYFFYYIWKKRD